MFGANLKAIGAAVLAAAIAAPSAYLYARASVSAEIDAAVVVALGQAEKDTDNAINELADEADRARLRRRLCLDRGGVWSYANNECHQG